MLFALSLSMDQSGQGRVEIKPRTYNCHHEKLKDRTREEKIVKNGIAALPAQMFQSVNQVKSSK